MANITSSEHPEVTLHAWQLVWSVFILLLGIFGNIVVCLVIGKSEEAFRTSPFNKCILSLATADLLLVVFAIPVYLMVHSDFRHPSGVLGNVFCKLLTGYFIPFWIAGVSVFLLMIISLERLRAVSQPLVAMTDPSSRKINIAIAGAWIGAFILQIPTIIGRRYNPNNPSDGNYCEYRWNNKIVSHIIYGCYMTIQYLIPLITLFATFIRIWQVLSKSSLGKKSNSTSLTPEDMPTHASFAYTELNNYKIANERRHRSVLLCLTVVIAFCICWTPNNIMFFLYQYESVSATEWNSVAFEISLLLCFTNSCINPILYAFQAKEFRNRSKKLLSSCFGSPQ